MKQNKCYWCDNEGNEKDHFVPFSLGGKSYENLVLACRNCNATKQNKIWLKQGGKILKPKSTPKKFAKVIEFEKYYMTIVSLVSVVQKHNKINRRIPLPKNIDYSSFGDEIDFFISKTSKRQ